MLVKLWFLTLYSIAKNLITPWYFMTFRYIVTHGKQMVKAVTRIRENCSSCFKHIKHDKVWGEIRKGV